MLYKICLLVSICNVLHCSHADGWGQKEDIVIRPIVHHASSSIVTTRLDRGVIDLVDVPRVGSEDSPDKTTVNVATTVAVKARCCNSTCCDDDKVYDCCC